ncbi:MAG: hypothetical protein D3905_08835 [Candidatus Electrothrix sp. AS4_5]|nr:hypothetical protein [Candidatus Electrothrix gigas]
MKSKQETAPDRIKCVHIAITNQNQTPQPCGLENGVAGSQFRPKGTKKPGNTLRVRPAKKKGFSKETLQKK